MNPHSPLETVFKEAATDALSASERAQMRQVVADYMALMPAHTSPAFSFWSLSLAYLRQPAGALVAAVLVLIVASGGAAYAAEGSLPGDTLYSIKTSVTEPARTALTLSSEDKVSWEMTLAERRLDEAATLADEGRLATSTAVALAGQFSAHATQARALIEKDPDGTDTVIASARFSARLDGYRTVLEHFAAQDSQAAGPVADAIPTQVALLSRWNDENDTGHVASDDLALARVEQEAHAALKASGATFDTSAGVLTASSSLRAEDEHAAAFHAAVEGSRLLSDHDTTGAFRAFQASLSESARLEVLSHAAAKFKIDAFASGTPSHASSTTSRAATSSPSGSTTSSGTSSSSGSVSGSGSGTAGTGSAVPSIPSLPAGL